MGLGQISYSVFVLNFQIHSNYIQFSTGGNDRKKEKKKRKKKRRKERYKKEFIHIWKAREMKANWSICNGNTIHLGVLQIDFGMRVHILLRSRLDLTSYLKGEIISQESSNIVRYSTWFIRFVHLAEWKQKFSYRDRDNLTSLTLT